MRQPEHIQQKTSKNLKGKVDISREKEWRKKKKKKNRRSEKSDSFRNFRQVFFTSKVIDWTTRWPIIKYRFRFIDGRVNYYELGGIQRRNILWKKWCEHVENLLASKMNGSSLSETTAASSSSSTTLYILSSEIEIRKNSKKNGKRAVCRWYRIIF